MVAALQLGADDDVMLISQGGTLVRTSASQISVLGRNTQGVRLMRIEEGDLVVSLARVPFVEGESDADVEEELVAAVDGAAVGEEPAPPAEPAG